MRLFLALSLTLIVGLGAAFRPSGNLPGHEVGAAESCRVIGGGGLVCTVISCGTGIRCNQNSCISSPGAASQCNASCTFNGGCAAG
jgi:hypothetical protein